MPRPDLGPKPHLGYTESRIERAAELRMNGNAVAMLAALPTARAYVIGGEMIVMKAGGGVNGQGAWRRSPGHKPRIQELAQAPA